MANGCVPSSSVKTVPFRIHPLLIPFLVATLMNQLTPKNAPHDFWPRESDLLSVLDVPLFHVAGNILHRRNLGFLVGVHRRIGNAFFTACQLLL